MKLALFLAVAVTVATAAHAAKWQAELPGGAYIVDTAQIVSVSTHEYIVDGAARVVELTVATSSSVIARFYHVETLPQSAYGTRGKEILDQVEQRVTGLASRVGQEPVWKKVVKNYPTTTHAHTVEYRLETKEQVQALYNSVAAAWMQNKDAKIKVASTAAE